MVNEINFLSDTVLDLYNNSKQHIPTMFYDLQQY